MYFFAQFLEFNKNCKGSYALPPWYWWGDKNGNSTATLACRYSWNRLGPCLCDCRSEDTPANTQRHIPYTLGLSLPHFLVQYLHCTIYQKFFSKTSTPYLLQCMTRNKRARPYRTDAVVLTSKRSKSSISCCWNLSLHLPFYCRSLDSPLQRPMHSH